MLILTRRPGEALLIGDDVEVIILDVVDAQVRLGIAAPRYIAVDRKEIRIRKNAGRPAPRSYNKQAPQAITQSKLAPRIILRRRLTIENPPN